MKHTILALTLLLAAPRIGYALEPALLISPTTPSDGPAPLALCAALPTTEASQMRSEQTPSARVAVVTCSSYCGPYQCLGRSDGSFCVLGVGICTQAAEYCSTDGIKRCFCKWPNGE